MPGPNPKQSPPSRLSRHTLELVEQPVAADDLAALARVRRAASVPIAADESVRTMDDARRIIALGAADALVIKPMVCGGLAPSRAILGLAAGRRRRLRHHHHRLRPWHRWSPGPQPRHGAITNPAQWSRHRHPA
ncbi:MAG: enolase C-terminal domain-like protein [Chloroflexia bacterium]